MRVAIAACLVGSLSIGCAGTDLDKDNLGTDASVGGGRSDPSDNTNVGGAGASAVRSSTSTARSASGARGGAGEQASATASVATSAGGSTSTRRSGTRAAGGSGGTNAGGSSMQGIGGATPSGGSLGTGSAVATGGGKATSESVATGGSRSTRRSTATGGERTTGTDGSASGGATTSSATAPTTLKKFVGNITTSYNASMDYGGKTYSKYWDQVTPENAGKWGSVQSSPGSSYNWKSLDAIYDYAQKNNVIFKQHAFIWGAQQPGGTPTAAQVQDWMKQFCTRYPQTKIIDVVNEPPPHTSPSYANNMGGGTNGDWKWIANAFIWARAACPNAILVLNDYNNIEWSNDNQHSIDIVKKIQAQNAPIDAIGCQAHDLDYGGQINLASVKKLAEKLHNDTGLPLYITEMDISTTDDNAQLTAYKNFIPYFLEAEWIHGITIWGWHYGQTWGQAPNSGLVRNGNFRSAMTWLMQTLGRPTS